jgi:C_GCAxxG_C_C family probable redox protein
MLETVALKYYLEQNMNCAEAILYAANEYYNLGLDEMNFKMVGGFGGGFCCGSLCGAMASSISVISLKLIQAKANETPGIWDKCENFIELCKEKNGSELCKVLKEANYDTEKRCFKVVGKVAALLENYMATL